MICKKIVIVHLLLLVSITVYAQNSRNNDIVANIQNSNSDYIDAIKLYEKVIEDGRLEDETLFIKIASAYYFKSDFKQASQWFEKYYKSYGARPLPIYNYWYGQSLKALKRYKEADSLLAPYFESKGERYIYSNQNQINLKNDIDRYQMQSFKYNTKFSDYAAYLHKDRLYFVTNNSNGQALGWSNQYTSTLQFIDGSNNAVQQPKGDLNSKFNEGSLVITRDGKTMYFTRNSVSAKKNKKTENGAVRTFHLNIYKAELKGGKWDNIKPLSINNPNYSVGHPALSPDDNTLYFASDMPGGKGSTDLYSVSIKENGSLGKPVNLETLNTLGRDMFPFIDRTNGYLYFSSDRANSLGGLDVYVASLESNNNYGEAYNIGPPINSSFDDFAYMINAEKEGYFSSNKEGEQYQDEIYSFIETKPFVFPTIIDLNGYVANIETKEPIIGVEITPYSKSGEAIETVLSNGNGRYNLTPMDLDKIDYVQVKKSGFLTTDVSLDYEKLNKNGGHLDIKLVPVLPNLSEKVTVTGKIKDETATNLNSGIPNAVVTLYDINGNAIATIQTDENGAFNIDDVMRKNIAFVRVEKEGYLTEDQDIQTYKIEGDEVQLNTTLSNSKIPITEGTDIASFLNTIYFDFGKTYLRKDAVAELEKIVQILKAYPDIKLRIGSHTDSQSSWGFNQKLSQKRAKATYDFLVIRGISPNRLTYRGYGESRLVNRCRSGVPCSEAEHQENRRSEFIIFK